MPNVHRRSQHMSMADHNDPTTPTIKKIKTQLPSVNHSRHASPNDAYVSYKARIMKRNVLMGDGEREEKQRVFNKNMKSIDW